MEPQRAVLLIFLILFFLFSPDTSQSSRNQRAGDHSQILRQHEALENLRNASYGQLARANNGTNNPADFGDPNGFSWNLLPEVQTRARAQYLRLFLDTEDVTEDHVAVGSEQAYQVAAESSLPLYQNVSGTIKGKFVRRPITSTMHAPFNLTSLVSANRYVIKDFWRNVTEPEGGLTLRIFEEDKDGMTDLAAKEITANAAVQTESAPGSGWEIKLYGVHYHKTGSIILTTTSEKFPGIFTLPHFALTRDDFEKSQKLLNRSLSQTISDRQRSNGDDLAFPWLSKTGDESTSIFSAPSCEYIIYLQQQPVPLQKLKLNPLQQIQVLRQIEQELRFPKGAPIPEAPPMVFSDISPELLNDIFVCRYQ